MDHIVDAILELVRSPWFLPALYLLVVADALLPLLPSEAVVAALGALSVRPDAPLLLVIIPVAAIGAMTGDSLIYAIGAWLHRRDPAWLHRRWAQGTLGWVGSGLQTRPALLIITSRYIPGGRQFVNVTAGATGFAYRRFVPFSIVAGITWACYNAFIGLGLGAWLREQPLLAVILSVVIAVGLGLLIDLVRGAVTRLRLRGRARLEAVKDASSGTHG